jgi:hypothetical protein
MIYFENTNYISTETLKIKHFNINRNTIYKMDYIINFEVTCFNKVWK